jgi:hypothetical protein
MEDEIIELKDELTECYSRIRELEEALKEIKYYANNAL